MHEPRLTRCKGKVTVACTCGFRRPPARYLDPLDVHRMHVERASRSELQAHFAAKRGA